MSLYTDPHKFAVLTFVIVGILAPIIWLVVTEAVASIERADAARSSEGGPK